MTMPSRANEREVDKNHRRSRFPMSASTADWLGRRVRSLPGSGGWDGETGVVIKVETHPGEYGWFKMLFDNLALRRQYPGGILTHSTEVELIRAAPKGASEDGE